MCVVDYIHNLCEGIVPFHLVLILCVIGTNEVVTWHIGQIHFPDGDSDI